MSPNEPAKSQINLNNPNCLDTSYWEQRWQQGQTGWDLGEVSPPLKAYLNQLKERQVSILIPGCGNAYEAAYLAQHGFTDVTVLDIAPAPVARLKAALGNQVKVEQGDFFDWTGTYDLILEQTFFCALLPELRPDYVKQMHRLLKPQGKLVGVLFNRDFEKAGPPFGGSLGEYQKLFAPYFNTKVLSPCYNSALPRQGTELFMILEKKSR